VYAIRFIKDSQEKIVLIDDFFPASRQGQRMQPGTVQALLDVWDVSTRIIWANFLMPNACC